MSRRRLCIAAFLAVLAAHSAFFPPPAGAQTVGGGGLSIEPRVFASLDRFRLGGGAGVSALWNAGGERPRRAGFSVGAGYFSWAGTLSDSGAPGNIGEIIVSAFAEIEWPRALLGLGIGADLRALLLEDGTPSSNPGFLLRPTIVVRNPLPLRTTTPRLLAVPEARISWSIGGGGFVALPALGFSLGVRFQPAAR